MCSTFIECLGPASSHLPQSPPLFLLSALPLESPPWKQGDRYISSLLTESYCGPDARGRTLSSFLCGFPSIYLLLTFSLPVSFLGYQLWVNGPCSYCFLLFHFPCTVQSFFFISLRQLLPIHPDPAQMIPTPPGSPQVSTTRFAASPPQEFDSFLYSNA